MRHCDDYIDDPDTPAPLRDFLAFNRSPASETIGKTGPALFAFHEGKPVRVVMASRLGDVGITFDLQAERGYKKRVPVSELTDFADTQPEPAKG